MAEFDRGRVAAMLAADADLELAAHLAAALDADPHQFADALLIDRDEGIGRQNAARGVDAEERGRVVATDAERGLRQVVGAAASRAIGTRNGEQDT